MSYCRWSCDGGQCDIYAYYSIGDFWQIHIANRRRVERSPSPIIMVDGELELSKTYVDDLTEYNKRMEALGDDQWVYINLPFDGEDYDCGSIEEFKDKMLELRAVGYQFPDGVLEEINEEIAEGL